MANKCETCGYVYPSNSDKHIIKDTQNYVKYNYSDAYIESKLYQKYNYAYSLKRIGEIVKTLKK